MIGKNGNFLTAHYDWIAAGVAVLALAGAGWMFMGARGVDPDACAQDNVARVERLSPGGEAVKTADLTDFNLVSKIAKNPKKIDATVTDDQGSFLASEARMFCTNATCQAAVPKDAASCPVCGANLEIVKAEETDADGDGMPNAWEKKYGLNPNDPADANADLDGDGYTNLEEFEAKTDPADKTSHPDYLDALQLQLPLKETKMPFHFTGTMKTPSGLKFQFKDPSRAREYDRGIYSVRAGEEIGKSGFTPETFVEKSEKRKMGGGMEKKVDVSEAIVVRKSDGKKVALTLHRTNVPVDVQATLVYGRDGGKTFTVVAGDTIELSGSKYVIKEVKRVAKGATVTIETGKLGKTRMLSALEH